MNNKFTLREATYNEYDEFLYKEINKVQDAFILGTTQTKTLPLWNMMFLLLQLRNEDYASARPTQEKISCMSDKLLCFGINTTLMEQIWPASYTSDGDSSIADDGVAFMQIQGDGTQHPINRVR